jgi:cytidyltransferase-like protein
MNGLTKNSKSTAAPTAEFVHGALCCRLQPLHDGHIHLIRKAMNACDLLTLVVGSAQEKRTESNPFSYEERSKMVHTVFDEEIKQGRLHVIPVDDIHNLPKWAGHVLSCIALQSYTNLPVTRYFAGSEADAWCFAQRPDIKVTVLDRSKTPFLSGTQIRKMMKDHDLHWKEHLPEKLWPLIEDYSKEVF